MKSFWSSDPWSADTQLFTWPGEFEPLVLESCSPLWTKLSCHRIVVTQP